jgi:hypothetical protein
MIMPDIFNNNPSAKSLGLEVSELSVLSVENTAEGASALSQSSPTTDTPCVTVSGSAAMV